MKTSVWGKSILALVFTFMCSLAISAASPKDYLYDTKEENGKIISKVVFLQENGLRVDEKTAEQYVPFGCTEFVIQTNYGMWDKKKKNFSLNVQNMIIPSTNYEEIFS